MALGTINHMSFSSAHRLFLGLALTVGLLLPALSAAERITLNFNPDWRFLKADPAGASAVAFDDSAWVTVSAPHTYNDTDTFDNWSTPGHRGEQIQWSGRTWYRKAFTLPSSSAGKKVFIEFEAARQIAEVYLNGQLLGVSKSGFSPFGFDLTPYLRPAGQPNVLAVMCDNRFMKDPLDPSISAQAATNEKTHPNLAKLSEQFNETIPEKLSDLQADQIPWNNPHWHPAHGGLYRNVRLHVTDPLHITLPLYSFLETAGPYAYATAITEKSALIGLEVPARNERTTAAEVELHAEVFDATGRSVLTFMDKKSVAAGASIEFKFSALLAHPRLWEPDYPHVYRVVSSLRLAGDTIDTSEIPLGIRHARWDTASGFYINGQHVKLHGWGQKPTNEWAGLGAALPDWLHFYTLELMRTGGGNFVRWGHAAAGPALISAGDRLGLIALQPGVDGEHDTIGAAWKLRSSVFRDTIIYFRNNPSILLWEGGNQKISRAHAQELRGYMDKYDPHGGRAYTHRRADAITAEFMDVGVGTEGGREIARLPVVEGEYNREESPRRVWDNFSPPNFGYPEAKGQTYQLTSEQFAINQIGHYLKKLGAENHAGGGNWIFSDSTSGGRVAVEVARNSGEVDAVRLPKPAFDVMTTMWSDTPQVKIIGHWTYPAGTKKNIYVAANAADVELFLNGQSLGQGKKSDRYLFTFPDTNFAPGELKAVAKHDGKIVATDSKRTAGAPVALRLTAMTAPGGLLADGSDIALIDVEVIDAQGQRCPTLQPRVDFTFTGPGTWRGGYNSGKLDSTNNLFLDLEAGINRVAVRAGRNPGKLIINARSTGLASASIEINSVAFTGAAPDSGRVALPAQAPVRSIKATTAASVKISGPIMLGKFIKTLNYTAPNAAIVHVEVDARPGKNAYVNAETPFPALPSELVGADWVQADDRDSTYSAVDLMEIAVSSGSTVTIAHDDRLPRPAWLTKQFKPTGAKIIVVGHSLSLFTHSSKIGASFTLGANTEDTRIKEAAMYIVFVNGSAAK